MQIMSPVDVPPDDTVHPHVWGGGWRLLAWHKRNEQTMLWLWRQEGNTYCTLDLSYCRLPS